MKTQTLQVEVRQTGGKGPARQLRIQGKIPAVLYGPGVDTTKLTISPSEFVKALATEMGRNAIFDLPVAGAQHLAIVKEVHVHPVSREPMHVDFYRVTTDREIAVNVPLRAQGRSAGVHKGGTLQAVYRELPIRCTPDKIPASITVDVTPLEIGDAVKVEEVPVPEGVRIALPPDRRVITVSETKKLAPLEEEGAAPAEGAPGAPGTPAAPATPAS
jgi:large subunit ribosomal protein L25